MQTYIRDRHVAVVDGPFRSRSTHLGIQVSLYRVTIKGQTVFSSPSRALCRDWLVRQGYRPQRE